MRRKMTALDFLIRAFGSKIAVERVIGCAKGQVTRWTKWHWRPSPYWMKRIRMALYCVNMAKARGAS